MSDPAKRDEFEKSPVERGTVEFAPGDDPRRAETAYSVGGGQAVGSVVAWRYKLLERIGEGGMGEVWVAEQSQPVKRKVALKLIKPGMDSRQVIARFEAERQALALMDHPNIAKVLDGGLTEQGRPFFVMEYVKGAPITEYCDAARLSVRERLGLFGQVCQAVQHAHQKGIIHRDLKPSNILVAVYDGAPAPKVIDFGLAKAMHQSLTERTLHTAHETVLGTPLYMSPEQAQVDSLDVDTRTDVYSLGVVLYELLTGTTPLEKKRFKEAAWDEVRRIIREEEPPRPSTRLSSAEALPSVAASRHAEPRSLTSELRGELDWIVMKAIEKDRGRRYETANGFAMDVGRYLAGEAVLAAPPSKSYRLRKFIRRNKGAVTAAAVVAASLIVGITVATTQAIRARRAEAQAVADRERAEESFRQAREAVDQYFTTVSESKLLNVPGLQPLRKELLDAARTYYRNFLKERGDDPAVKADAAAALFRVGWVSQIVGEAKESLEHFVRATDLYGELAASDRQNVEYQRRLAMGFGAQGVALEALGRADDGIAAHKKALAIREALLKQNPSDPMSQIDVARTHRNMGGIYRDRNKTQEASVEWEAALAIGRPLLNQKLPKPPADDFTGRTDLAAIVREDMGSVFLDYAQLQNELGRTREAADLWKQGIDLFEGLARDLPQDLVYRARLGDGYAVGADMAYMLGRYDESLQHSRRALEIRTALADANPSVPYYRRAQIESLLGLGWNLGLLKRDAEALETCTRATELAEKMLAQEPRGATTRNHLAQSLARRAGVLDHLKRTKEGVELARRAVDIQEAVLRENPDSAFHQSAAGIVQRVVGRCEMSTGNARAAIAAIERAAELDGRLADKYPEAGLSLACDYAMMATLVDPPNKEAAAARAVETLRKAMAKGYSNLQQLKTDEDLERLRGREDFKKMLAEMEKKTAVATK